VDPRCQAGDYGRQESGGIALTAGVRGRGQPCDEPWAIIFESRSVPSPSLPPPPSLRQDAAIGFLSPLPLPPQLYPSFGSLCFYIPVWRAWLMR